MKAWKILIGVVALFVVSACGGDDQAAAPQPATSGSSQAAAAPDATLLPTSTPAPTYTPRPTQPGQLDAAPTWTPAPTDPPPKIDFYKGKTIRIVVGSVPGGGYDFYSRMVAKHMAQYIPGEPDIIVQNMPGAGGIIGQNFLYNQAKPDGLTIAPMHMELMGQALIKTPAIKFDFADFEYLGHIQQSKANCAVSGSYGASTLPEVIAAGEIVIGAFASTTWFADLLNATFGTNLKNVAGYSGTGDMFVAVDQGEVYGFCGYPADSIIGARADWLNDEFVVPFILFSLAGPDPLTPDVPLFTEYADLAKSEAYMEVWKAMTIPYAVFRPYAAPPKTPQDRVLVLRDAFWKTVNDAEFISDNARVGRSVNPLPYDQFKAALDSGMKVSDEALAIIKTLY